MNSDQVKVLEKTQQAITDLITVFQNNPMELLYECDYQAHLYATLRKLIREDVTIRTSVLDPESFKKSGEITTPLVHTEYPCPCKGIRIDGESVTDISRFDVAIIDPELKQDTEDLIKERTETVVHQNEGIWSQRVQLAIQLKFYETCEMNNRCNSTHLTRKLNGLEADLAKLGAYRPYYNKKAQGRTFTGLAILFVQSCTTRIQKMLTTNKSCRIENWDGKISPGIHGYIVTPTITYRIDKS